MNHRDRIALLAAEHTPGDYRELCPACEGGTSREKSLALRVYVGGAWGATCFRASCGWYARTDGSHQRASKEPRYFTAERHELTDEQKAFFIRKFGFVPQDTFYSPYNDRFVYRVSGPHFEPRGWVARSFSGDSPKVLTYVEKPDQPFIGYTGPMNKSFVDFDLVIVEDWISCEKVGQARGSAVSLNGCALTTPILQELVKVCNQGHGARPIFAVDADAYAKSLRWLADYGGLFVRTPRVWKLKEDLKYVRQTVIRRALENADYNDFTADWATGTKDH